MMRRKPKIKDATSQTVLAYITMLGTPCALAALDYIDTADRVLKLYVSPRGVIGVNAVKDGLMKYKEFKDA